MTIKTYDVAVLGVGGMGSAACYHLARQGVSVIGIEQFGEAHALGSSHGDTRLIRKAYFEEQRYIPLLHRAYELWDELEQTTGRRLFHKNGLLILSDPAKGMALQGLLAAAQTHGIPVETLDEAQLAKRFAMFRTFPGVVGVLEPAAGYLEVENCVRAYATAARDAGAELLFNTAALSWRYTGTHFEIITKAGTIAAPKLVVTAGPWAAQALSALALPLTVRRIPQMWFGGDPAWERVPCFAYDLADGFYYGFPKRAGMGVKMAEYKPEIQIADPNKVDRGVKPGDSVKLRTVIDKYLVGLKSQVIRHSVCLYTMTPDEHFIVDKHPTVPDLVFAAGFSGHGFKFASVMGEILAELSLFKKTKHDISFLSAKRFVPTP